MNSGSVQPRKSSGVLRCGIVFVFIIISTVFLVVSWSLLRIGFLAASAPPEEPARLALVQAEQAYLEHALKEHDAARQMQNIFPEGANFLLPLYGLTWA